MAKILVVDDEKNIREGIQRALKEKGYEVIVAANAKEGLLALENGQVNLAILDIQMPRMTGLEMMQRISKHNPELSVVFITGHGSIETAVEAMRLGAYDFLTKPINLEKLEIIVSRALRLLDIQSRNKLLTFKVHEMQLDNIIIGKSKVIMNMKNLIKKLAPAKGNVFIYGESGTGKEGVCDSIYKMAGEQKKLVKINCAALSPSLIETELFGHEKGAFTGADERKIGRFEVADGGMIFLDEVSEIPLEVQVKLLRVIQEKVIERVGGSQPISVDIRIISASNKDLRKEVEKGNFREDLFYRLNVLDIYVPPLRERGSDLGLLAKHFFDLYLQQYDKDDTEITPQIYSALASYRWPGNIRELMNVIEKVVVLSNDGKIKVQDLPDYIRKGHHDAIKDLDSIEIPFGMPMNDAKKIIFSQTVKYYKGNKSKAADVLKISRKTLYRKLLEP